MFYIEGFSQKYKLKIPLLLKAHIEKMQKK